MSLPKLDRALRSRGMAAVVVAWMIPAGVTARAQQSATRDLPTVAVFSTGGTISGRGASPTSLTEYKAGAFLGEELVAAVPAIKQYATVNVEQVINVGSPNITLANWLTLANRVNAAFGTDPKLAGVVITHGTNTLEETAYFLNLTVQDARPVVLVGAQRPATAISSDGPLNLLNAIRTAASPDARGKGVLVVMNEEISAARDVTKTNTYRVETFKAPELGFLGYVDADQVSFYRAPTKRHTRDTEFDVSRIGALPAVDIVYSYVEPSPAMLSALIAARVKGIVFAGTGAGGISPAERAALKPILSMPVGTRPILVRSSRTGNGRVVARSGDEELDMIPADTLNPQKARILLMLALTKTTNPAEIRRMFAEY